MEQIVLGRVGHYHDAGNGSCSTAIVTEVQVAGEFQSVNVAAWHHGGEPFSRTSVPVDSTPDKDAEANTFHLTRDCPWER